MTKRDKSGKFVKKTTKKKETTKNKIKKKPTVFITGKDVWDDEFFAIHSITDVYYDEQDNLCGLISWLMFDNGKLVDIVPTETVLNLSKKPIHNPKLDECYKEQCNKQETTNSLLKEVKNNICRRMKESHIKRSSWLRLKLCSAYQTVKSLVGRLKQKVKSLLSRDIL